MALTEKLTAVADAIRRKTGDTASLTLGDMAARIDELKTETAANLRPEPRTTLVGKITDIADAVRRKTGTTASLTLDEMASLIDGIKALDPISHLVGWTCSLRNRVNSAALFMSRCAASAKTGIQTAASMASAGKKTRASVKELLTSNVSSVTSAGKKARASAKDRLTSGARSVIGDGKIGFQKQSHRLNSAVNAGDRHTTLKKAVFSSLLQAIVSSRGGNAVGNKARVLESDTVKSNSQGAACVGVVSELAERNRIKPNPKMTVGEARREFLSTIRKSVLSRPRMLRGSNVVSASESRSALNSTAQGIAKTPDSLKGKPQLCRRKYVASALLAGTTPTAAAASLLKRSSFGHLRSTKSTLLRGTKILIQLIAQSPHVQNATVGQASASLGSSSFRASAGITTWESPRQVDDVLYITQVFSVNQTDYTITIQ